VDDVNLKQVFLNSFPESHGNEAYQALEERNVTISQTTLGELYQLILNALAKLCNQKKFLAEFERTRKCFRIALSILNPNILPDHYWKPHHQNFMAANGEKFVIDKISVPINIRLFPKCVIKIRLLGSSSYGKDLLIGFDILHKLPNLRWTASKTFLADDKIPLPQKKSLFRHLADARVLSKFDLKSGFWQLDFLPKLSHHTAWLFPMLKKNPPQWMSRQTKAVKAIKSLAEKMPPLKIVASLEKRILQTDYKVNPSSSRCERKLQTLYTDTRSLMTRANGVDPDKISYHVMWNISIWSEDHLDAYKWIEANRQWLYDNFDHCEVETSDGDDDARSSIDLHNSPTLSYYNLSL
nr:putative zinc finger, CCHC-type [Tanacetum cinerariifolium]